MKGVVEMYYIYEKLKNRFVYFKEKNITKLILLFIFISNALLILLGGLFLKLLPGNEELTFFETFWSSLRLVFDPGGFLESKLSATATVITCLIVMIGTVTFSGGIIGYASNYIMMLIDNGKKGYGIFNFGKYSLRKVNFSGHTLILNWNDKVMPLINEYYLDKTTNNRTKLFVILTIEDKEKVTRIIDSGLKNIEFNESSWNKHRPRIIVRTGNPLYRDDLDKVNWDTAKNIIIMQPDEYDENNADFNSIKLFSNFASIIHFYSSVEQMLEEDGGSFENCNTEVTQIIVEVKSNKSAELIENFDLAPTKQKKYTVNAINVEFLLGKIYAKLALTPLLSNAVLELFCNRGSEFGIANMDKETGWSSIENDIGTYKNAIPIYDISNCERVYLTEAADAYYSKHENVDTLINSINTPITPKIKNVNGKIIIFGTNKKLKYILRSLSGYSKAYPESNISVLLMCTENDYNEAQNLYTDTEFENILTVIPSGDNKPNAKLIHDIYSPNEFVNEIDSELISFLIMSSDNVSIQQQDYDSFILLMNINSKNQGWDAVETIINSRIIVEIKNPSNAEIVYEAFSEKVKVLVSDKFESMLILQLCNKSSLKKVLLDIITTNLDSDMNFLNDGDNKKDDFNLQVISVKDFYGNTVKFTNKADCIKSTYIQTQKKYIPIGCIKLDSCYLFSTGIACNRELIPKKYGPKRDRPNLFDGTLIDMEGNVCCGDSLELTVEETDDYIIKSRNQLILTEDDSLIVICRS